MNKKYDDKLSGIEQFKLHPTFLPFVGDCYEEYRVLQIGESHYLNQDPDNEKYNLEYFLDRWWSSPCCEVLDDKLGISQAHNYIDLADI